MRKLFVAIGLVLFGTSAFAQPRTVPGLVPYTVSGRIVGAVSLLVAPGTTDEQLTALINAFRTARVKGTLSTLISATTPGAKVGTAYNVVTVFVLSDRAAGSTAMLNMFVNQTSTPENEKEWGKRILAYYWCSNVAPTGHQEEGTLGYQENRIIYTNRLRKLF
jgi:hypothetical protein